MPTVIGIWSHKHTCRACNSNWYHDLQECFEGDLYPEEHPCPICEDSADPDIKLLLGDY